MTDWVLSISEDGCETQLTSRVNLDKSPQLNLDTEGKPLIEIKSFQAVDYEAAKVVMEKWLDEERWEWEQANSPYSLRNTTGQDPT